MNMTATFDVYANTAEELEAEALVVAGKFFGGISIEAEAIQLDDGHIVGWVGHVRATR